MSIFCENDFALWYENIGEVPFRLLDIITKETMSLGTFKRMNSFKICMDEYEESWRLQ